MAMVREAASAYTNTALLQGKANKGTSKLSDTELLSIFFGCSLQAANQMINKLGGLSQVLTGDQRLTQEQSLKAKVASELMQRSYKERMQRGEKLADPEIVRNYLISKLRNKTSEVFSVLFLDNHHRLIECEDMFFGTIDGASVYPREVVKAGIKHNAAAVIFAHNHPSGVAEPSQSDERITRELREALGLIDTRVLDHFIIGDRVTSFAERGLL